MVYDVSTTMSTVAYGVSTSLSSAEKEQYIYIILATYNTGSCVLMYGWLALKM